MSLRIHTGDICVINSERDSMKEYNGVVCQVASYYPAEIDESKISNLHDVIVLGPALVELIIRLIPCEFTPMSFSRLILLSLV